MKLLEEENWFFNLFRWLGWFVPTNLNQKLGDNPIFQAKLRVER